MRVTFLIRERQLKGTALQNAAAYDAAYLKSAGHEARVIAIPQGEAVKAPSTLGDIAVIEGAGWVGIEAIKAIRSVGTRVVVRVHAAPECLWFEWMGIAAAKYIEDAKAAGVEVACVSEQLAMLLRTEYLPMVYPVPRVVGYIERYSSSLHIGCFGAIRPLKNHVGQLLAVAAARMVSVPMQKKTIYFHINSTRIEGTGHILTELDALSKQLNIRLVKHDWVPTDKFKNEVIPLMDLGLFGSYAESFGLTAADFVAAGIPSVLSTHIPWSTFGCGTDVTSMAAAISWAVTSPGIVVNRNVHQLRNYSTIAGDAWLCVLSERVGYVNAH